MAKSTMDPKNDGVEENETVQSPKTVEPEICGCPSENEIDALIRKRVYASIGVGFVPVPLVDLAGMTAIQLEMIYALSKAYGIEFKKERVKAIISSLCSGILTTAVVPLAASLFKSIPIIGTTTGAASISILGASTTYALGYVFDRHFRKGGNLTNFDTKEAKEYFKSKIDEGKTFIKSKTSKETKPETGTDKQASSPA